MSWIGLGWGRHREEELPRQRAAMAPAQFMLEYWKFYDGYIRRKEHLIEASITAYSGLAILLLTRPTITWQKHGASLIALALASAWIVERFIASQFRHWQSGNMFSVASQTLAADWLSRESVDYAELTPITVEQAPDVRLPAALARELASRRLAAVPSNPLRRLAIYTFTGGTGPFARLAYCLLTLWFVAFSVRVFSSASPAWWGLAALGAMVRDVARRLAG
jgi:hypothetical protein